MVFENGNLFDAFVLRSTPGRGRGCYLDCFTRYGGRIKVQVQAMVPAFSMVECEVSSARGDWVVVKDCLVVDTFEAIRSTENGGVFFSWLHAILSCSLPYQAPSERIWALVTALLEEFGEFVDWKAPLLLLALTFFEQEGLSPEVLSELKALSCASRALVQELIGADIDFWKKQEIPEEVFQASLESIGVMSRKETKKN